MRAFGSRGKDEMLIHAPLSEFEERAQSNSLEFAEFVDELTGTGEVKVVGLRHLSA